jgi:hypothetical protein
MTGEVTGDRRENSNAVVAVGEERRLSVPW